MFIFYFLPSTTNSAAIQQGSSRNYNSDTEIEDRRNHNNRRRRPCRGRDSDGRTFFDFPPLHYYTYNVNLNYICGEGGGHNGNSGNQGFFNRPIVGALLGTLSSSASSLPSTFSSLTSSLPDVSGIVGSIGAATSQAANSFSGSIGGNNYNNNNNNGGGFFGLGLFDWFGHHNRPSNMHATERPQQSQQPQQPDKPVHEDYDDVPEAFQNSRPGQYFAANKPGSLQDITNFNPNRIIKNVNQQVSNFFKPLYNLLRR